MPKNESAVDTSPASEAQLRYINKLAERIASSSFEDLDTTEASQAIDRLNSARRLLGLPYKEF